MLNLDPPDHHRLRRLVSKVFTPRTIEELRPRVQQLVDEHLDAAVATEHRRRPHRGARVPAAVHRHLGDARHSRGPRPFAAPRMVRRGREDVRSDPHTRGIARGVRRDRQHPRVPRTRSSRWKREQPERRPPQRARRGRGRGRPDERDRAHRAGDAPLRRRTRDDGQPDRQRHARAAASTATSSTCSRRRPLVDATFVDELLRYDSPVQMSRRITLAPYEIGGTTIEPGSILMTCLGSANRDPAKWGPSADDLDLRRADARDHMSFGGGFHSCLGAAPRPARGPGRDHDARPPVPALELASRPTGRAQRPDRPAGPSAGCP